mmetsp:Transcript_11056/g.17743  ORF Transcript_11056/g.17743 Transcript_11056/m.17743 type:complete len:126 (-) Transcript_11056:173-550(-)
MDRVPNNFVASLKTGRRYLSVVVACLFTKKECDAVMQEHHKKMKITPTVKVAMGAMVYYSDPANFYKNWMKAMGIPKLVWYLQFRSCYLRFLKVFQSNVNALKNDDNEPPPKWSFWDNFQTIKFE